MTNRFRTLALLVIIAVACGATGRAQDQSASKAPASTQLRVQVVLSKYQGDKKISSLPYTLSVNSERGSRASLRMGAQVPIVASTQNLSSDGKSVTPLQTVNYRDVGTNIDCQAYPRRSGWSLQTGHLVRRLLGVHGRRAERHAAW